jgi:hypothetical protein
LEEINENVKLTQSFNVKKNEIKKKGRHATEFITNK